MTNSEPSHSSDALIEALARWREEANSADANRLRDMGTAFEDLCLVFLRNDPTQQTQFSDVWRYTEWARSQGLSGKDTGIDLVAKLRDEDSYCAIQCKFYAKGRTIPKGAIDSFLSASGTKHFSRRLVIDTSGVPWTKTGEATARSQEKAVSRLGLDKFLESPIEWSQYLRDSEVNLGPAKTPRPHQEEAIEKVLVGLADEGTRGKLIMACGTGKTYTSLRIAEDLVGRGGRVLYLVPSLALMSQTVREWAADARIQLRAFAACSDAQVGKRRQTSGDSIGMDALDLAFPATTDPAKLAEKATPQAVKAMTVVFATYHSLPVIGKAQKEHGLPDFDLAICDEAHRTAGARMSGENESHFVQIHDDRNVKADRRMYMTATPRVYAETARNKARKVNAALCSMEDEALYGPVLYQIGFGRAVEDGLLTDYKVIVLTVHENSVVQYIGESLGALDLKIEDAGKLLCCWRALAKADQDEFPDEDPLPMRRAIAYTRTINSSKSLAESFEELAAEYRKAIAADEVPEHQVAVQHVDGTFNAAARQECLNWLDDVQPQDQRCHVLSNVRCLAEGVDVPALDAILFMHPRKSQIDVVQAVGRVMRRAAGKQMGYVVLPVVIPINKDPESVLDTSTFRVVWQVLNAIRSHDERFEALINLLEEGHVGDRLGIITLSDWRKPSPYSPKPVNGNGPGPGPNPPPPITDPVLPLVYDLPAALRAKIVEKCGNRRYWDEWAGDVAKIAQRHILRITDVVEREGKTRKVFEDFLAELRDDLNEGIAEQEAIEMLAQHMVTRPVFEALHGDAQFAMANSVSQGMQRVLAELAPSGIEKEAEGLDQFYDSVRRRAKAANTPTARHRIITELYDKFFRNAFPKTAEKLGIVYTPIELVDFILHSVEEILQDEFGESLSSPGVEILDPFTGTGTFITRIIQNGLINKDALPAKYAKELHANEIMLLAYYIAAVNIEAAYHEAVGSGSYERFEGIVLTDTFELQDTEDLLAEYLPENSEQRKRQKAASIRVIVSNPPWSVGQRSENDATSNQPYPDLDKRIQDTYAAHSHAALKRNLYDSYVRAIRWASDRIERSGVIGFVTNAGWLDRVSMDGLRNCLEEEFTSIYVLHFRGNARTQGDRRRREGDNVFGLGSRAPVAITLLVRNPEREGCKIQFHDIGDYLRREEKLQKVAEFRALSGVTRNGRWQVLAPDKHYDWLNQRDPKFETFMALGDKGASAQAAKRLFDNYSLGIVTSRDAWCFGFSKVLVMQRIESMAQFYEHERYRLRDVIQGQNRPSAREISLLIDNDPQNISWSGRLKDDLARDKPLSSLAGQVTISQYRPFTRQYLYFSRRLNERVYQMPHLFPHSRAENRMISVSGRGGTDSFSCLMVKFIPEFALIARGQCYPRYHYEKPSENAGLFTGNGKPDEHGYVRKSAISEPALENLRTRLGLGAALTADVLFHYVYGVLHVPAYRKRFAANLSKELARIPFPVKIADFWALVEAGEALGAMHCDYDDVEPWELSFENGGWKAASDEVSWFRVEKPMKHPGKDSTRVAYNEHITVKDVPPETQQYMVNGKPAVRWVMERQCVRTDKASGIVNDANRYALETMNDPAYPLKLLARVIRISVDTVRIVNGLPDPEWR